MSDTRLDIGSATSLMFSVAQLVLLRLTLLDLMLRRANLVLPALAENSDHFDLSNRIHPARMSRDETVCSLPV